MDGSADMISIVIGGQTHENQRIELVKQAISEPNPPHPRYRFPDFTPPRKRPRRGRRNAECINEPMTNGKGVSSFAIDSFHHSSFPQKVD
jgi:hypothetical protein